MSTVPSMVFGQPPVFGLQLNQSVYGLGETMSVTARLSPGSSPSPVDVYVVVQLPTGQFFSLQLGGAIVPGIVPIAPGIVPIAVEAALLSYIFSGIEPPGAYTWYSVLTRPVTLEFVTPLQQVAFTLDATTSTTSLSQLSRRKSGPG